MITHTAYLAFAAEHRARIAHAERFGHHHADLPRRSRRSGRGRSSRPARSGARRASMS
jgi:hypothetical protein